MGGMNQYFNPLIDVNDGLNDQMETNQHQTSLIPFTDVNISNL